MAAATASVCYRFAHFELQPNERRLLARGEAVALGPHAFDLLVMLVERRGQLVGKDELLARVWGKVVVEENTLQVHVSTLRRVLGRDAIATVSGRGYRFVYDVVDAASGTSAPPKNNLPHALTSFVGREKELGDLERLLGLTRLLTLTGSGGCGKTRLAIELARQQFHGYPGGAWLVQLAALGDPALLPQTVATVLDIQEKTGVVLVDTIAEVLGSRPLLLVLDNAEHLIDACAQLAETLLQRCARLVIVVTSRERLRITGEATYRVPSLSVPNEESPVTPESIAACEAPRLFIERARLQNPRFAVTEENATALASICRRLDGIPLAIELAAPRVRSMSMEEVSKHLDQRFELLTEGSRTALPRHRTLRSLIDWSHDLLSEREAAILRRLSVFAGGWTLEAAERVCVGAPVASTEVLDLLTSMVDKNLVVADERAGETRFGLLETVRHYARDRMGESAEAARVDALHLAHFVAMAEQSQQALKGPEQRTWLQRLDSEHDNVRAALARTGVVDGDVVGGLRLAAAMFPYWSIRGLLSEARSWLDKVLAASTDNADALEAERAKTLYAVGVIAMMQSDHQSSIAYLEECLPVFRRLGNRRAMALALGGLGYVLSQIGKPAAAQEAFAASLVIYREIGDKWLIANALINQGEAAIDQGNYALARASIEEAVALHRAGGDSRATGRALNALGRVARHQGDLAGAAAILDEALTIHRTLGDRLGAADATDELARLALMHNRAVDAQALHRDALSIHRAVGAPDQAASTLEGLGNAVAATSPLAAARLWGHAQCIRERTGAPIHPQYKPENDRFVAVARETLGDQAAFDAAWQDGRAMTLDQVTQYAMSAPASLPDGQL